MGISPIRRLIQDKDGFEWNSSELRLMGGAYPAANLIWVWPIELGKRDRPHQQSDGKDPGKIERMGWNTQPAKLINHQRHNHLAANHR